MSRVAWIDGSVGVAGDMLLAALLDAGADPARVRAGMEALGLLDWELHLHEVKRGAFRALRAEIRVEGKAEGGGPPDGTAPPPARRAHHPWLEIRRLLEEAFLPERVRASALATYERLARAEAHVHGIPLEQVVFHEVGAVDAVLDIVGVCLALEDLGVQEVWASSLPMGTGQTDSAHGRLPLPAPATLEVLKGWPVVASHWPGEWVTPTGAALVATLAKPGGVPAMRVLGTGHGAGRKDPPQVANLARVVVGEDSATASVDEVIEISCNLDDQLPEHVPTLLERLLYEGALDAWASPLHMKKGRPGLQVSVLVAPADEERLSEVVLRHSSTLGVRRQAWERRLLDRWHEEVHTAYGPVRMKVAGRGAEAWRAAPEHEDVRLQAEACSVALLEVHQAAVAAWRARHGGGGAPT